MSIQLMRSTLYPYREKKQRTRSPENPTVSSSTTRPLVKQWPIDLPCRWANDRQFTLASVFFPCPLRDFRYILTNSESKFRLCPIALPKLIPLKFYFIILPFSFPRSMRFFSFLIFFSSVIDLLASSYTMDFYFFSLSRFSFLIIQVSKVLNAYKLVYRCIVSDKSGKSIIIDITWSLKY